MWVHFVLKSSEKLHRDSTYLYLIGFRFPSDLTGQRIFPQDYIFTEQEALLLTRASKYPAFLLWTAMELVIWLLLVATIWISIDTRIILRWAYQEIEAEKKAVTHYNSLPYYHPLNLLCKEPESVSHSGESCPS